MFASGAKCWQQRLTVQHGRTRTLGLGGWPVVTPQMAREAALANARMVKEGKDPYVEKHRTLEPTFAEAIPIVVEIHKKRWKKSRTQKKHAADWVTSLERYACPAFGNKPISAICPADVLGVVQPLLTEKPRTGERLRHRIGAVMRWAMLQGYRTDDPTGRVLDGTLAKAERPIHFKALPHAEVGAALALIRASEGWPSTKLLLEFLILTAARSQEVRLARWSEIDFVTGTWTKPAEHTKTKEEHDVPLSSAALDVLVRAAELAGGRREGLIFPSRKGGPISNGVPSYVLKRLRINCVPHGFRTSFRGWCAQTRVDFDLAEFCLAHKVGNNSSKPYNREELLDLRRPVMQAWGKYVCGDRSTE